MSEFEGKTLKELEAQVIFLDHERQEAIDTIESMKEMFRLRTLILNYKIFECKKQIARLKEEGK
jgi:hypothetical protein